MYRAPTQRESTGLKTRHYEGRKKDGALKGRRYEDKCEEWARCIVSLREQILEERAQRCCAPTERTGLKSRHYKGRKKDGALKGRRYEDKCEEWARCIVPLRNEKARV